MTKLVTYVFVIAGVAYILLRSARRASAEQPLVSPWCHPVSFLPNPHGWADRTTSPIARTEVVPAAWAELRPIHGGSDDDLIMELIRDTKLCLDCIVKNTGLPTRLVVATLARMARLKTEVGHCAACRTREAIFSITTDEKP